MKRKSTLYGFLKIFVTVALKLFYRKIEIHGYEQVPKNTPMIFSSNHQGTLMDAILIICCSKLHIASLTRADIFKKPIVKRLLNALMMIPIYRPRDQVDIRDALLIFPEGSNGLEWHLRSFKKGVARLAFGAEVNSQFNLNLHIVPVGIHYTKHEGFRSKIVVHYGQPIKVSDYQNTYEQSVAKGIKQLIENYDAQVMALDILQNDAAQQKHPKKMSQLQLIQSDQNYINQLTAFKENNLPAYEQLIQQLNRYINLLKPYGFKDKTLAQNKSLGTLFAHFFGLMFLSPLWLWAVLNCGLAYLLNWFLIKKMGLTIFFMGSIKFVLGLFVSGFLFLLQAIILAILFKSFLIGGLYFISLPLLGIFWYHYNVAVIQFMSHVKKNRLIKSSVLDEVIKLRQIIIRNFQQSF